jgi:uncharacterized lipoprotein YajG
MTRTVVCLLGLMLAACQTTPVTMRNVSTGQTATCGPFYTGLSGGEFRMQGIAMREAQCIKDFKEQGYIRVQHAE